VDVLVWDPVLGVCYLIEALSAGRASYIHFGLTYFICFSILLMLAPSPTLTPIIRLLLIQPPLPAHLPYLLPLIPLQHPLMHFKLPTSLHFLLTVFLYLISPHPWRLPHHLLLLLPTAHPIHPLRPDPIHRLKRSRKS
jgi:hypothetical protein